MGCDPARPAPGLVHARDPAAMVSRCLEQGLRELRRVPFESRDRKEYFRTLRMHAATSKSVCALARSLRLSPSTRRDRIRNEADPGGGGKWPWEIA